VPKAQANFPPHTASLKLKPGLFWALFQLQTLSHTRHTVSWLQVLDQLWILPHTVRNLRLRRSYSSQKQGIVKIRPIFPNSSRETASWISTFTSFIFILVQVRKSRSKFLILAFNIEHWTLEFDIDDIQYPTYVSRCEMGPNSKKWLGIGSCINYTKVFIISWKEPLGNRVDQPTAQKKTFFNGHLIIII
jgi:hypothetical protein